MKFYYIASMILIIIFTGCSSKLDIKENSLIPEQSIGTTNSLDYSLTEQIIKNNPNWNKELENETLRFNMFVQDTFNEIENKKEYLKKIYNVQYYNFDEKGFNSSKNQISLPLKEAKIEDNKKNIIEKQSEVLLNKPSNTNTNINQNNINKKEFKSYETQIFNEYNF